MQTKVAKIVPSESDASSAGAVVLGDGGPTLLADVVIMGVGVAPATGFLKESGFTLEKDGGVLVDEYLRVKDLDGVYAIGELAAGRFVDVCLTSCVVGDIAVYPQTESPEPRRIEHWNVSWALFK
jgi:apoptosis-inducing factor 3